MRVWDYLVAPSRGNHCLDLTTNRRRGPRRVAAALPLVVAQGMRVQAERATGPSRRRRCGRRALEMVDELLRVEQERECVVLAAVLVMVAVVVLGLGFGVIIGGGALAVGLPSLSAGGRGGPDGQRRPRVGARESCAAAGGQTRRRGFGKRDQVAGPGKSGRRSQRGLRRCCWAHVSCRMPGQLSGARGQVCAARV